MVKSTADKAAKQNTAVLPVPLWLCTITSRPSLMGTMDLYYTADGLSNP